MKSKNPLLVILALALIIALPSCKTKNNPAYQAYFKGATHKFTANQQMVVLPGSDQSTIYGAEPSTQDTLTLVWSGSTTGTYLSSSTTYMVLATSGKYYYSSYGSGSCIINVTSMTSSNTWAEGNFSGSLYNPLNLSDSINLSQGTFSLSYQM